MEKSKIGEMPEELWFAPEWVQVDNNAYLKCSIVEQDGYAKYARTRTRTSHQDRTQDMEDETNQLKLAHMHNENMALKRAATGRPNTQPEIEGLREGLALVAHVAWPKGDALGAVVEAAKRYAAQSRKCTCEESKIKCLCCTQVVLAQ